MPFAVTHILTAVILIELFREYFVKDKQKFPRYYILIAAIGGIIPDLDFAAYYILSFFGFTLEQIHKTFFHTLFIPLALFLIGLFMWKMEIKNSKIGKMHMKLPVIFFIFAAGSLLHLTLDALFDPIRIFYPISTIIIGIELLSLFPESIEWMILPTLDGILLFFWLFWMEFKLRIRDYF